MSTLRDKARKVRDAGVAERGNFEPTGAPKRLYQYWLARTRSVGGRKVRNGERAENFCHFWRVVLFWAPLMWLRRSVAAFVGNPITLSVIFILGIIALVWALVVSGDVRETVLFLVAIALALASVVCGVFGGSAAATAPERRASYDLPEGKAVTILFIVGLPSALVVFTVAKVVQLYSKHLREYTGQIVLGAFVLVVLAFLTLSVVNLGWLTTLAVVAATIAFVGVIAAIAFFLAWVATIISGRRALARDAHRERINAMTIEEYDAYRNAENAPRKRGPIAKFFSGVGDFLILATQVVRVNKWKICPLVEVDNARD